MSRNLTNGGHFQISSIGKSLNILNWVGCCRSGELRRFVYVVHVNQNGAKFFSLARTYERISSCCPHCSQGGPASFRPANSSRENQQSASSSRGALQTETSDQGGRCPSVHALNRPGAQTTDPTISSGRAEYCERNPLATRPGDAHAGAPNSGGSSDAYSDLAEIRHDSSASS